MTAHRRFPGVSRPAAHAALILTLTALTLPGAASAVGTVGFSVDELVGARFALRGMTVSLDVWPAKPTARITIRQLELPAPVGAVTKVLVQCSGWSLTAGTLRTRQCRITADNALVPGLDVMGTLTYELASKALSVRYTDLPYAGGRLSGSFALDASGWQADFRGSLQAEALRETAEPYSPLLAGVTGEGIVELSGSATGTQTGVAVNATVTVRDIEFANTSGTAAGEGLQATMRIDTKRAAGSDDWQLAASVDVHDGETFLEPVYLNFSAAPLHARIDTRIGSNWQPAGRTQVSYRHANTLSVEADIASMTTRPYRLAAADIVMTEMRFPQAYAGYLKGFLVGTPLTNLQTTGRAEGVAKIREGAATEVSLLLDNVGLDDPRAGFALYEVAGELQWRDAAADRDTLPISELTVGGAFISNISVGRSRARLSLQGTGWRLLEPVRLPIYEGALEIQAFGVDGIGSDDLSFEFQAELEPIGLRRLTTALNWPVFPGQLSGRLPLLNYKGGQITVGGTLEAKAFDGLVTLENLRIEQPFGVVPELDATIRMRNLDLALLTNVFTIGRIEGRLDGDIVNLKMLKGQPVAFDARFYTPADDNSRRRISQRAVGSISGIGGDSRTPALTSGFMRFFQDFAYERLGINCRLDNDVCNMSGIEPADQGYFIVKGRSLPRIDVIGYTSEVEWTRLVNQVQEALQSGSTTTRSP